MVRILIDHEKCNGEEVCLQVCPKGPKIYSMAKIKSKKVAIVKDSSYCLGCKICVSRCPMDAITIDY